MGETLPGWIWVIYYLFLTVTLTTTFFCLWKKKLVVLCLINLLFVVLVPVVSLVSSMSRTEVNEFEFLVQSLSQGAFWAIIVFIGYLVMFIWWVMFFRIEEETR
ncbi:hypothetical protein [Pseudalkalibacillus caeni]|uniref:Uncharacterized protein n=1 Tax=Exobacillus caeni TaxID=2574798 RepID=A0A5R9F6U9_9BACL|nr:hypothetical protein [Pseudalkalibacillus caeni]TLS36214.1 hypothetical protein FCL54_16400 [Pseudalkalibacillus caeni]